MNVRRRRRGLLFGRLFHNTGTIGTGVLKDNVNLLSVKQCIGSVGNEVRIADRIGGNSSFRITFPLKGGRCDRAGAVFVRTPNRTSERRLSVRISDLSTARGTSAHAHLLIIRSGPRLLTCLDEVFDGRCEMCATAGNTRTLTGMPLIRPTVILDSIVVPRVHNSSLYITVGRGSRVSRVTIILVSTLSSRRDVIGNLGIGTSTCIAGPFSVRILRLAVRGLLRDEERLRRHLVTLSGFGRGLASTAARCSLGLLTRVQSVVDGGLSDPSFAMSILTCRLHIDHAALCGGMGKLVKRAPSSLVERYHVDQTGTLLHRRHRAITRITSLINFSSRGCFHRIFGGTANVAPDRCTGSARDW